MYLVYAGDTATHTNPVQVQQAYLRSKTKTHAIGPYQFYTKKKSQGCSNFQTRAEVVRQDLNKEGTFTLEVELTLGGRPTPPTLQGGPHRGRRRRRRATTVWYPRLRPDALGSRLYDARTTTADVIFRVGAARIEIPAHRCVVAIRAPALYEMVVAALLVPAGTERGTAASEEEEDDEKNERQEGPRQVVPLPEMDPMAFRTLLEFIYLHKVPELKQNQKTSTHHKDTNNVNSDNDDDDDDKDEEQQDDGDASNASRILVRNNENEHDDDDQDTDEAEQQHDVLSCAEAILIVANRFGCTELKLYMESYLVEYLLVPAQAARLLLLADAHACPLLKEACLKTYVEASELFMASTTTDNEGLTDWEKLQESSKLLTELLVYTTSGHRTTQYSSVVDDGDGTIATATTYDVTSLRERLEKYQLETDGSREMLCQRWIEHLNFGRS